MVYLSHMNEFTAKKLGEVYAFTIFGHDTLNKGGSPILEKPRNQFFTNIKEKNEVHGAELKRIAEKAGVSEAMLAKAEKTVEKLKKMREVYIGDQWQNATEVCEWSGFFEGAAIVHWQLLRGAEKTIKQETLLILTEEGVNTHYEFLEKFGGELEEVGQAKAI